MSILTWRPDHDHDLTDLVNLGFTDSTAAHWARAKLPAAPPYCAWVMVCLTSSPPVPDATSRTLIVLFQPACN